MSKKLLSQLEANSIDHVRIAYKTTDKVSAVVQALANNTSVTSLELSGIAVTVEGMEIVVQQLQLNTKIEYLMLCFIEKM